MAIRALNPVATVVNPAATGPVSDVSNPTLTEFEVTPGALAPFVLTVPPPLVVELPLLPHAAVISGTSAAAATSAVARLLSFSTLTTDISWSLGCAGTAPASRVVKDSLVMSGITVAA
jgi:hypothetical protein